LNEPERNAPYKMKDVPGSTQAHHWVTMSFQLPIISIIGTNNQDNHNFQLPIIYKITPNCLLRSALEIQSSWTSCSRERGPG
jgi:hypothetical protein